MLRPDLRFWHAWTLFKVRHPGKIFCADTARQGLTGPGAGSGAETFSWFDQAQAAIEHYLSSRPLENKLPRSGYGQEAANVPNEAMLLGNAIGSMIAAAQPKNRVGPGYFDKLSACTQYEIFE